MFEQSLRNPWKGGFDVETAAGMLRLDTEGQPRLPALGALGRQRPNSPNRQWIRLIALLIAHGR
jgi:hypothetical protein